MIQTLDPFHDEDFSPAGFPGGGSNRTVVQRVKFSKVIGVPSNVTTGNWDCNMFLLPYLAGTQGDSNTPGQLNLWNFDNNNWGTAGAGNGAVKLNYGGNYPVFSGLVISTNATGQDTILNSGGQIQTMTPAPYIKGPCRLVSAGFEVVNTTAEIYLQGDVTAYRCPEARSIDTFNIQPAEEGYFGSTWAPAKTNILPPGLVGEAILFPNSRTWPAKRGGYVQAAMFTKENPLDLADCAPRLWRYSFNTLSGNIVVDDSVPKSIYDFNGTIVTSQMVSPLAIDTPFQTSGLFFTGLSQQTTLRVTVIFVIERVPTWADTDLVVLAKDPCPFNTEAIRMVIDAQSQLPPGCPQDENPAGEWWKKALKMLGMAWKKYAVPVATAVGGPEAGAVVATINTIGGQLTNLVRDVKQLKKSGGAILPVVNPKLTGAAQVAAMEALVKARSAKRKATKQRKKAQLLLTNG